MKINREMYYDRVHACWTGKNIGGTMGTPYEGKREMLDISGFSSPKGEPLANDDLDLQLIWLCAVEDRGIRNITPQLLGEYWLNYIVPHWNEYGIAKANMKLGIAPPYSGEYHNEKWKNSNGAWIRTEVWACLFPGFPKYAAEYAYRDACVDHGMGEGTYAAMFVAAMESAAFFETDVKKLINVGLSYIPEDSRVAKSVRLAVRLYLDKTDFKTARNAVVKETEDLGWFQAPANVAFVILGLLYGEGDYKKSMIHAINCGDDTDCTGATIGSIMGIMHGSSFVPDDWAEYIGDSITSVAIDMSYMRRPRSCTELTERIANLLPSVLKAYRVYAAFTDGETEREEIGALEICDFEIPRTGLSIDFPDLIYAKGRVEFDRCIVAPGDTLTLTFVFKNRMPDPKYLNIAISLPEGWTADKTDISMYLPQPNNASPTAYAEVRITVGETVHTANPIYAKVGALGRITSAVLPIPIWGN